MEKRNWTVPQLLEAGSGYWSTCTLHAGVKLDIFTHLSSASLTAQELAAKINCDSRGLGMLLNALAALDLLTKSQEQYAATEFSSRYLSRSSDDYLGHIIMHHHNLISGWARLDEAVRSGAPVRERVSHQDAESARESFLMGMFNLGMQSAPVIVPQIDLGGRKRLLDLGGGPGTYAIHFCLHNPDLTAVVCDLPTTREFAEKTAARFGLTERISFEARDFETEEVPTGFDVVWLSHVLHGVGPDSCARLLRKAAAALNAGGMIMVQEFILDDGKDASLFPALFSLNMLIGTPDGQSYSEKEIVEMLSNAGAREIRRIPLQLPNGAGIVTGMIY